MSAKRILFGDEAREELLAGVHSITRAVRVTLGPEGRHVQINQSWGTPTVTKDGVSVARAVELPERFQNMAAQLVKEAASKTAELAGDGTTTATVLAAAILEAGHKLVAAGYSPIDLKRGVDRAVATAVEDLAKRSRPARETEAIVRVGTIAANGDERVGWLVAEALEKVGNEGVVTVELSQLTESTLEVVDGMELDRGYLSPSFVTNPQTMEAVLENPLILLHERSIHTLHELLPLLQQVIEQDRPILVIAEDVDGEALATLVVNRIRGSLESAAVEAPGFGDSRWEMLQDLAILTGAQLFSADLGLEVKHATLGQLGSATKVVIDKDHTTLIGGGGAKRGLEDRCRQLRAQVETAENESDRERLRKRLAKLAGGVGVIRVGGSTESEMKERKDRVDDALRATRAAIEEGVVPGGGVALLRAQRALEGLADGLSAGEGAGVAVLLRALEEPLRRIAENAGMEGAVAVNRVRELKDSFGFNARTEKYEDLLTSGVMDATKVVRSALQNAASVATLLLTTDTAIVERD